MAIMVPEPNRQYALSALLPAPLPPAGGLVVQYEAQTPEAHACGGAYLKLLSPPADWAPARLRKKTPYSIMFGPDRCGGAARVHLILKCFNPALGDTTEHHLAQPPSPPNDKLPHVYTLLLSKDGGFRVLIDGEERAAGRLDDAAAFAPPLVPEKTIPDPDDVKPEHWDEREEIDDPDAVKPSDWDTRKVVVDMDAEKPQGWLDDEPTHFLDETAQRPAGWDDAKDGMWMPPEVENPRCKGAPGCGPWKRPYKKNPAYKGVWLPPRIKNPNYQGEWKPRVIPNPAYFEGGDPPLVRIPVIGAVAFELWTTDRGYIFDGVLVAPEEGGVAAAEDYRLGVWRRRYWEEYAAAEAAHRQKQISEVPAPARHIMMAFERPPLSGIRRQAIPLLELLYAVPSLAWVILLLPPAGAAALVAALRRADARDEGAAGGGRRRIAAAPAAASRAAAAGARDDEEEEEEEDGAEGSGSEGGAGGGGGLPAPRARTPEAEAGGGGGEGAVRRRPRRA